MLLFHEIKGAVYYVKVKCCSYGNNDGGSLFFHIFFLAKYMDCICCSVSGLLLFNLFCVREVCFSLKALVHLIACKCEAVYIL